LLLLPLISSLFPYTTLFRSVQVYRSRIFGNACAAESSIHTVARSVSSLRCGDISMIGVPWRCARVGSPAAGHTEPEVPTMTTASAARLFSSAFCQWSCGRGSPNHTTPGRMEPPQFLQSGGESLSTGVLEALYPAGGEGGRRSIEKRKAIREDAQHRRIR